MPTSTTQHFRTRVIEHQGGRVRVALQDENGPCPLLALANCLALRGELTLVPRAGDEVTSGDLINALAAYALERLAARGGGADDVTTGDVVECLPRLVHGMDINVRFTAPDAYEATPELAVFDALGVRLLHGWVADPAADGPLAELVTRLSYNALVDRLIADASAAVSPPPAPHNGNTNASEETAEVPDVSRKEPANEASAPTDGTFPSPVDTVLAQEAGAADADVPTPPESSPPPVEHCRDDEGDGSAPQQKHEEPTDAAPSSADDDISRLVAAHGAAAREWLQATGSQLSYSGILALQETLHPGELAVLFRGGHYAVVGRAPLDQGVPSANRGRLVLLVTDVAMALGQVGCVWETLEDTDGAATRFLPAFPHPAPAAPVAAPLSVQHQRVSPPPQQQRHEAATRVVQGVLVPPTDAMPQHRAPPPTGTVVQAVPVRTADPAQSRRQRPPTAPARPTRKTKDDSGCVVA